MAANDYAILVGISRYADRHLSPLNGPVHDVALMDAWLRAADGGDVPGDHIERIVSDETAEAPAAGEMAPVLQDFVDVFLNLVRRPGGDFLRRPDGRLYLYLSGHGFCEKQTRSAHAALYTANADRDVSWNIYGTYFAQWAKDQGLFGEIVLIMDCCRDAELTKTPTVMPLRKATDVGVGRDVKLFELYAAPRGGKAQERPIPSRGNEVHGLLTHAFLEALAHADPDDAQVTTGALKGYLEERWNALCAGEPADPPEVIPPSNGEIRFRRGAVAALTQGFRLTTVAPGAAVEILGQGFEPAVQLRIGAQEVTAAWPDGRETRHPVAGGRFELPLPASLYLAVAAAAGGVLRRTFQAGDGDVEL